jgi:hypothetical protein
MRGSDAPQGMRPLARESVALCGKRRLREAGKHHAVKVNGGYLSVTRRNAYATTR